MLLLAHRIEVQRTQKLALNDIKEAKEFGVIKHSAQKEECVAPRMQEKDGQMQIL